MRKQVHRALFSNAFLKATSCLLLVSGASQTSMFASPENKSTKGVSIERVLQEGIRITGSVKDINGEPIIGANILEKGTGNGTTTDIDGNYSLTVKTPPIHTCDILYRI